MIKNDEISIEHLQTVQKSILDVSFNINGIQRIDFYAIRFASQIDLKRIYKNLIITNMQQLISLVKQVRVILLDIGIGSINDEAIFGRQDLILKVQNDGIFGIVIYFEALDDVARDLVYADDGLVVVTLGDGFEL